MKFFLLLTLLLFLISCQTVTISPAGNKHRYSNTPTYESSQTFWFFGLVGENFIDVQSICGDRKILQMQTQSTFLNQFFSVITIGIYTPRTAKIWCKK